MHQYRHVLWRMRQGESDRQLAAARLMGRHAAARLRAVAVEQGWLDAGGELPDEATIAAVVNAPRRACSTVSSLEAHRQRLIEWAAAGVSGVVMHATLKREHGCMASYSAVRRLLTDIRRAETPPATCRLHFEPGEAAQVDFGAGPRLADADGTLRRTWAFVMTLCFSRHQYVEFVWDQTVATWLGCHRRAFEWFGAVPARVVLDNAKCAITRACARDPLVQRAYAECAEGYGFKIDPCPPHDPQKKGIVEAGVKYVKGNFLPLRQFRDLADLNAQARSWVLQEAGQRTHGTTCAAPLALFELERPTLRALPAIAPDLATWQPVRVHRDCHVQFERVLYSAPFALVGQTLWLRATDGAVALYQDYRQVATHPRGRRPGERLTVRDHLPPQAQAFFAHDRAWCLAQAGAVGSACRQLVERLLGDRIVERLRAAQGVVGLRNAYGPVRLEAACARALAHDSPHYRTVKTILATGADQRPAPVFDTPAAYTAARFARAAASLFATPQSTRLH